MMTTAKVPQSLLGKSFFKTSFQLRMDLKKDKNKAEMKERKKTTRHLQKYIADVGQSSCVLSSLPCFCPFFSYIVN